MRGSHVVSHSNQPLAQSINHIHSSNSTFISSSVIRNNDDLINRKDNVSDHNNSSEIPSSSVSPCSSSNSNHCNHSGGAKFLKKMWVQKYQGGDCTVNSEPVNQSCSASGVAGPSPAESVLSNHSRLKENGLNDSCSNIIIPSNNNNLSTSNGKKTSSHEKSSTSSTSDARVEKGNESTPSNVNSNSSKGKGMVSKKSKKDKDIIIPSSRDCDGTDCGSDTDPGHQGGEESEVSSPFKGKGKGGSSKTTSAGKGKRKVAINSATTSSTTASKGQKRGSSSTNEKEKKVKKIKSTYNHSTYKSDESDCTSPALKTANNSNNNSSDNHNRPQNKKSTLNTSDPAPVDSDQTEDEAEESVTAESSHDRVGPSSSSSPNNSDISKSATKRGRKLKSSHASSGKSSPTASLASTSSNKSKKETDKTCKTNKNNSNNKDKDCNESTDSISASKKKGKKRKSSCSESSFLASIDTSGKPFLQNKSCTEVAPRGSSKDSLALLPKCRECNMSKYQKIKKDVGPSIFCRFYQFRKLVFDQELKAAAFSEPRDAKDEDFKLWLPADAPHRVNSDDAVSYVILKKQDAIFLIDFVSDHFCNLVAQEAKALAIHLGPLKSIAWKSVVPGVREMCDVCETTLFNIHWVCSDCGFVVCIDCYKSRRDEEYYSPDDCSKQQSTSNAGNKSNVPSSTVSNGKSRASDLLSSSTCSENAPSVAAVSQPSSKSHHSSSKDRDRFDWLLCNNKQPHVQEKLILTQIIAKTALWDVCAKLHDVKRKLGRACTCENESFVRILSTQRSVDRAETSSEERKEKSFKDNNHHNNMNGDDNKGSPGENKLPPPSSLHNQENEENKHLPTMEQLPRGGAVKEEQEPSLLPSSDSALWDSLPSSCDTSSLPLSQASIKKEEKETGEEKAQQLQQGKKEDDEEDLTVRNYLAVRDLLSKTAVEFASHVKKGEETQKEMTTSTAPGKASLTTGKKGRQTIARKPAVLSTQLNGVLKTSDADLSSLTHFHRKITPIFASKNLPPRVCNLSETSKQFPDIPHDWFCDGRLLVLKDTGVEKNLQLFEQQWIRHQPVAVCKVHDWLERHLWRPSKFASNAKFADSKIDFINTETNDVVRDQDYKTYWAGFENEAVRPVQKDGSKAIFKLKDWPPGEEFSDALPNLFNDLMSVIPLPEYTTHDGVRNLAGRLPKSFGLIPDLGPKMYTAYGLASDKHGTTKLHLDISDAVNVMVYVGTLKDKVSEKKHQAQVLKALEEAGVEKIQLDRLKKEMVGALWHIYDARDADTIRDMLNAYALEKGHKLEPHHDPIHDQSYYLDGNLRERLKNEYGVEGYTIVQFWGDAIFIPAGAPHQVRNLSSCIKIAEDFVSPENVAHCFNLTEEFRQLSNNHDNHEDKLQIKNIIYHTVKDAITAYTYYEGKEQGELDEAEKGKQEKDKKKKTPRTTRETKVETSTQSNFTT